MNLNKTDLYFCQFFTYFFRCLFPYCTSLNTLVALWLSKRADPRRSLTSTFFSIILFPDFTFDFSTRAYDQNPHHYS